MNPLLHSRPALGFFARLIALGLVTCLISVEAQGMIFIFRTNICPMIGESSTTFCAQALSARATAQQNTTLGPQQPALSRLLGMSRRALLLRALPAAAGTLVITMGLPLIAQTPTPARVPPFDNQVKEEITRLVEGVARTYNERLRDALKSKSPIDQLKLLPELFGGPVAEILSRYGDAIPELSGVMARVREGGSVDLFGMFQQLEKYYERHGNYFQARRTNFVVDGRLLENVFSIVLFDVAPFPRGSIPTAPVLQKPARYIAVTRPRIKPVISEIRGGKAPAWTNVVDGQRTIVVDVDHFRENAGAMWDRALPYAAQSDLQLTLAHERAARAGDRKQFNALVRVRLERRQFGAALRLGKEAFIARTVPLLMRTGAAHELGHADTQEQQRIPARFAVEKFKMLDETDAQLTAIIQGGLPFQDLYLVFDWIYQLGKTEYGAAGTTIIQNLFDELRGNPANYPSVNRNEPAGLTPAQYADFYILQLPNLTASQLILAATRTRDAIRKSIREGQLGRSDNPSGRVLARLMANREPPGHGMSGLPPTIRRGAGGKGPDAQDPHPDTIREFTQYQRNILYRAGLNLPYSPQKSGDGSAKVIAGRIASRLGLSDPTRPQQWGSIYYRLMAYAHEHQPPIVELDSLRQNLLLDVLESLSTRLGFLPTEIEVFEMLQEGLSDRAIAIARESTVGATKFHIYNMQKKFDALYKGNKEFDSLRGELQVDMRMAAVLLNVYRSRKRFERAA